MKNTFENNSAKAARQSMLESAADSQQFASAECAATDTTMYQVNIHTDMDDEMSFDIVTYAEDGYKGVTRGTTSSDGSYEQTEWCAFVGTLDECQSFVEEKDKWCVLPDTYMYGRKGFDVLKVTPTRMYNAIFVGTERECRAEAERLTAENIRPMDYIADIKAHSFHSEEEAMDAINKMVCHLRIGGNEIHVRPFVDKSVETGLRGLGVEIVEVWHDDDDDKEYANWFSIGIEGSNWNTRDVTIIRGIQAAAYLTWLSVKNKALRCVTTLKMTENHLVWDAYKEYDLVDPFYNVDKDRKFEECEYANYLTYSTITDMFYKNIIDIVDILDENRLLKPIVLK